MVGTPKKKGRPPKRPLEEDPLADVNPKPSKRGRPKKIKVIKNETLSQPESEPIQEPPPPPPPQEEEVAGPTELPSPAAPAPPPVVKRGRGIRKSGTGAGGGGPKKVGVKGHHRNKDHIRIRDCIPDEIILPEDLEGFEHVEIFDGNYYLENNPRMERAFGGIGGMESIFNPAPRAEPIMSGAISFALRENVVFQMCPEKAEATEEVQDMEMETIDSQATQNLFL